MAMYTDKDHSIQSAIPFWEPKFLWIGFGALIVGGLEYVWGRDPQSTYLGQLTASIFGESSGGYGLYGPLGGYLPDFLHPFGFILLTLAMYPHTSALFKSLVCLGWLVFDIILEFGQLCGDSLGDAIRSIWPQSDFSSVLAGYFANGRFDYGDIAAMALGAVAAYLLHDLVALNGRPKVKERACHR